MIKVSRYCKKCILPDTYPNVSFNADGECNYCEEYRPVPDVLGKEALITILRSKGKAEQYDCVVPLSGGKDSTFILYYVVRELGLKPLAVNYDSGFQTQTARENVNNACRLLDVPLVSVKAPGNTQILVLREWIRMAGKLGGFYGNCGGNCEAILRFAAITTAKMHRVPFVLWGSSIIESGNYAHYLSRGKEDFATVAVSRMKILMSRLHSLVKDFGKVRKLPSIIYFHIGYHSIMYRLACIYQRLRMGFPYRYAFKPQSVPPFTDNDPKFIHFFSYVSWDSLDNAEVLMKELQWTHPVGRTSRFDCFIHCLLNQECLNFYGISGDGANACKFIRAGKMEREAAEKCEQFTVESLDRDVDELLETVGLRGYNKLPKSLEYLRKYGAF